MLRRIRSSIGAAVIAATFLLGHAHAQDPHIPVTRNPIIFVCFDFSGFPVCFNNSTGFGFLAFQSAFSANTNFGAGQIVLDPIIGGFFGGLFGFPILFGPVPAISPIPEMDATLWAVDPFAPFDFAFWPLIGRDTATGSFSLSVGLAVMINPDELFGSGGAFQADVSTQIAVPNRSTTTAPGVIYRDAQGRARIQLQVPINNSGGTATMAFINDPVAQVAYILNYADSTAYEVRVGQMKSNAVSLLQGYTAAQQAAAEAGAPSQNWTSLGSATVQGFPANGKQITRPAEVSPSSTGQMNATTQIWKHATLGTPVQTSVNDQGGSSRTLQLSNLVTGVTPAASLFQIPSGFTVTGIYPPLTLPPPSPPPPKGCSGAVQCPVPLLPSPN